MQKIVPCIWRETDAEEVAAFYASVFPGAGYDVTRFPGDMPEVGGRAITADLTIRGYRILLLNVETPAEFTPALSFMVGFNTETDAEARSRLDTLWDALAEGGSIYMPLDEYPFSPRYGWVRDRYGVSWQLMLTGPGQEEQPFLVPELMFGADAQNRAGEASVYYAGLFENASYNPLALYTEQTGPATPGSVMFGGLTLENQWFAVMDSGAEQETSFTPAISLQVLCEDQAEIDRLWAALSAIPEAEACGWCVDRFGVSWQIVPRRMDELTSRPGAWDTLRRMKKIEIADF
jgi:predicted 3-demethylubiquinone-9 3-methyltransferase (glyoxalase superfamily)